MRCIPSRQLVVPIADLKEVRMEIGSSDGTKMMCIPGEANSNQGRRMKSCEIPSFCVLTPIIRIRESPYFPSQ
jgi:hypothetical protein